MEEKNILGVQVYCVSPGSLVIGQCGSSAAVLGGRELQEAGPDDAHDEDDDQDIHKASYDHWRQDTIGQ